jgi:hypothetical protein
MIDCNSIVRELYAAANEAPNQVEAARAVEPILARLKAELKTPRIEGDAVPMIRTWSPNGPRRGETLLETATRLSFRVDEIALAKRWGDSTDVQRMLDITLGELRDAALGRAS